MYEARLVQAALLKKIVDAVRELVTHANLDCSESGISMQAMDSSHVSLCALMIRKEGFQHYRCDRSLLLGLSMANIAKILKCAGNEDTVTLKAEDTADSLTIMFERQSELNKHVRHGPIDSASSFCFTVGAFLFINPSHSSSFAMYYCGVFEFLKTSFSGFLARNPNTCLIDRLCLWVRHPRLPWLGRVVIL